MNGEQMAPDKLRGKFDAFEKLVWSVFLSQRLIASLAYVTV